MQVCSEGLLRHSWPASSGRTAIVGECEAHSGRKVAIINQALATRYFSGLDAIGREIRLPRLAALFPPIPVSNVCRDWRCHRCEEPEPPGFSQRHRCSCRYRPSPLNCLPHHRAHQQQSGTVQRGDRSRGARGQSAGRADSSPARSRRGWRKGPTECRLVGVNHHQDSARFGNAVRLLERLEQAIFVKLSGCRFAALAIGGAASRFLLFRASTLQAKCSVRKPIVGRSRTWRHSSDS